jgi:hypothetical protein
LLGITLQTTTSLFAELAAVNLSVAKVKMVQVYGLDGTEV